MKRVIIFIIASSFFCIFHEKELNAQFYSIGEGPASTKWLQRESPNFKIIYPKNIDSLAKEYVKELEKCRESVSLSIGFLPGEKYKKKIPVVLHPYNTIANGSVVWAPQRMDLFTVGEAYSPYSLPWITNLAIHESRHLSQMQAGNAGVFRFLGYLIGELNVGIYAGLYPGPALLEGDAVVTETALTSSGRGRSAEFLNYYMVAFANNDWRDWYQWRYGSHKRYAPNHYGLGYLTVAGARYLYNDPLFMKKYLERIVRPKNGFLPWFNIYGLFKKRYGVPFSEGFQDIMDCFAKEWQRNAKERVPFNYNEQVVKGSKYFTTYLGNIYFKDNIYSIKQSFVSNKAITQIAANGKEKKIALMPSYTSTLKYFRDIDRLYWTEIKYHPRWSLKTESVIRYIDLNSGKKGYLTKKGRFFNPSISNDENDPRLSVSEYPEDGGSQLVIMDAINSFVHRTIVAPDSLQIVESTWLKGRIFVSGISAKGYGIYSIDPSSEDNFTCEVEPQPVNIKQLQSYKGKILFCCDRTGVDELYSYSRHNQIHQITSLRYGGSDFCFSESGDSLYYSSMSPSGKYIFRTASNTLNPKKVSLSDIYENKIANKLTEQERLLQRYTLRKNNENIEIGPPKKYRKLFNLAKLHSWLPFYFNFTDVMTMGSFDLKDVRLGATAFLQNHLGTASGFLAYSYHPDLVTKRYLHSAHLQFTYKGLYPVIELKVNFNERKAYQYFRQSVKIDDDYSYGATEVKYTDVPYFEGGFKLFVPLNFSRDGLRIGLIPKINYFVSNDCYDASVYKYESYPANNLTNPSFALTGVIKQDNNIVQALDFSLRTYVYKPSAKAQLYPRLGIGADLGYSQKINLRKLVSPTFYAHVYAYCPSVFVEHGMKFSLLYQHQIKEKWQRSADGYVYGPFGNNLVYSAPRGLVRTNINTYLSLFSPQQLKFSFDYAMPLLSVDWSGLSPLFYIKNFDFTTHIDYTFVGNPQNQAKTLFHLGLFSAGFDLMASLGNFLWVPYDTKLGVRFCYNSGSAFDHINSMGYYKLDRYYLGLLFNIGL